MVAETAVFEGMQTRQEPAVHSCPGERALPILVMIPLTPAIRQTSRPGRKKGLERKFNKGQVP